MPAKCGPGHPQKRLRLQDLVKQGLRGCRARAQRHCKSFRCLAYVAYCILHYTSEKATNATLQLGKRS